MLIWIDAQALKADSYDSIDQHLYFGTCELPRDPLGGKGESDLWLMTCVNAQVGHEAGIVAGDPEEHQLSDYSQGYLGFHILSWMSLHVKGFANRTKRLNRRSNIQLHTEIDREYAILRLGNQALHKYQFTVGEMAMPLGVHYSNVPTTYEKFSPEGFWQTPKHSATLTYDTQTDFTWDLSLGTDYYQDKLSEDTAAEEDGESLPVRDIPDALSFRTSYDIAALDGTRLIASFYAHNEGERRGGLGLVTVSSKGDITHFDWIRKFTDPDIRKNPFEQLVRFGYESIFRHDNRWIVQFDDHRGVSRMGMIANDIRVQKFFLVRIGVALRRKLLENDYQDQWYGSLGLEAGL